MELRIRKLKEYDEYPDLSYLGTFSDRPEGRDSIPHGHNYCENCPDRRNRRIEVVSLPDGTGGYWAHEDGSVLCMSPDPDDIEYGDIDSYVASPVPEDGTYRYFNPATEYGAQDYERMTDHGRHEWCMVGVVVEATLTNEEGFSRKFCHAMFGIEYDSDESYFEEVAEDLLYEIRQDVQPWMDDSEVDAVWAETEWEGDAT